MNKICLNGRPTTKPELKTTHSNVEVCSFTLAVNRKFKNQQGNYESDFINIVAFKNTAKLISEYVEKGDLIGIEGHIQTRNYENEAGKKVYVTEVVVEQIDFLQSKKKQEHKAEISEEKSDPFAEFGEQISIDENYLD